MERIRKAGLTENEVGYLWMDDSLGMLLDKLDEHGIADNTIIVFISDHGSNKKGSLFKTRGTEVPCLIRWPKVIPAGTASDELVQNTDFVPTWFDVARAKVPPQYRIDGVSLATLFADPDAGVRDYVYGEMGAARSIKTKEWNYISLRYTKDQIASLKTSRAARFSKTLLGLSGGISRSAAGHPGAFDVDQLYHLGRDPSEQKNLAANPEFKRQLERMQGLLTNELRRFPDRPYGEFVPGGNAAPRNASLLVLDGLRKASDTSEKQPARERKRPNRRRRERP